MWDMDGDGDWDDDDAWFEDEAYIAETYYDMRDRLQQVGGEDRFSDDEVWDAAFGSGLQDEIESYIDERQASAYVSSYRSPRSHRSHHTNSLGVAILKLILLGSIMCLLVVCLMAFLINA